MNKRFDNFHHITQETINNMFEHYAPVFTLTSGRSGSKLLDHIFSHCDDVLSYHEASPTLQYYVNYAFHNQDKQDVLKMIFETSRMELILDAYNQKKIFLESNQCLTFYAPVIKTVFNNAKFIHLIRHPGSFIRSALMKGWYVNDTIWESGRLRILDNKLWEALSQIEKLAWLWRETNHYISRFFQSINPAQGLMLKLEDLVADKAVFQKAISFTGTHSKWSGDKIEMLQNLRINTIKIESNEPPNMHKICTYPMYQDWKDKDKKAMAKIAGPLAVHYGYVL